MKLTYVGTVELGELSVNELLDMFSTPNLNPTSKIEINLELLKRLPNTNLSNLLLS